MTKYKFVLLFLLVFSLLIGCKKDDEVIAPVNNDPVENNINLTEPGNNTTINIFTPLLKWEQYLSSTVYAVQLSMDANFISPLLLDSTLSSLETNVPAGRLSTNVYYYWRVKADLGSGNFSNWSRVYRFRVILAPPPAPILQLPANNSTDQPFLPVFDWDDTPTAEIYRLQVSTSPAFNTILIDTGHINSSNLQCPYFYLVTGTDYYWRVNASNSNGASTGDWSAVFTFKTVNGPLPSSISGTVRFTDNNIVMPPFYYSIGLFKSNRWPPGQLIPDYKDSLNLQFANNEYTSNYIFRNIPNGDYHVTVYTPAGSLSFENRYKSVYGCDTTRVQFNNCPLVSPGTVTINNGNGIPNINLLSWADSSKSIF